MAKSILYNVLLILVNSEIPRDNSQPNLVFVLTDDLGWGDVSYNNHNLHTTPYLKKLTNRKNNYASILKQSYATHRCTPSRASFLTGRYAFRFGLGSDPIGTVVPHGMSAEERLLPEFLKEAGYNTHAIGKWHLGFCKDAFLPTNRGFDTHYGHHTGALDYNTHAIGAKGDFYLNHFLNGEPNPDPSGNYTYATFDWADRAIEVLNRKPEKPKFLYLAFNAPHEPVTAPAELIEKMKTEHAGIAIENPEIDEIPQSRLEHLAAVHAIDIAMESIIESAKKLERETIIVFMSDNGGALRAYGGGKNGPRACNFPYRGYKNTLFEGGTLSPTLLYSTKRNFIKKKITNMVHITDWFLTFLNWGGYAGQVPTNLDGVDQRNAFEIANTPKPRNKFIYGVVNTWDDDENIWTTQYAVRYGRWKYMNFRREGTETYKCVEGWSNSPHEKFMFKTQPNRDNKMDKLNETAKIGWEKPGNSWQRDEGFSLFNLDKDPFEMQDYGKDMSVAENSRWYMKQIEKITTYVAAELQKGFEYPITGIKRGKVLAEILDLGFTREQRIQFNLDTGRFVKFARNEMVGTLGTDWCKDNVKDTEILTELYHKAIQEGDTNLEYLINIHLWNGYGPNGNTIGGSRAERPLSHINWDEHMLDAVFEDF